jgi:hypothetical protein
MIRGNRWECGYCGNFGDISSLQDSERAKLLMQRAGNAVLLNLEQAVLSIVSGVDKLFGDVESEKRQAFKMAVYGMCLALTPPENRTKYKIELLQIFCGRYGFCSAAGILSAAQKGEPSYEDEFILTKERLGSYWAYLMSKLPAYSPYASWPEGLLDIVNGLSETEGFFSDRDSGDIFDEYEEAFDSHWSTYGVEHPDRTALEDMVRRWDFSRNEWACRDLLISAFPQVFQHWTSEELSNMETMELIAGTGENDPKTAVEMMKLLLDTAEGQLSNPDAAEQMLGNDLFDLCQDEAVQPLILRELKKDKRLAGQLFQSAYAGCPQESLLDACSRLGEIELREQLQNLLDENPQFKASKH